MQYFNYFTNLSHVSELFDNQKKKDTIWKKEKDWTLFDVDIYKFIVISFLKSWLFLFILWARLLCWVEASYNLLFL